MFVTSCWRLREQEARRRTDLDRRSPTAPVRRHGGQFDTTVAGVRAIVAQGSVDRFLSAPTNRRWGCDSVLMPSRSYSTVASGSMHSIRIWDKRRSWHGSGRNQCCHWGSVS
jgi:hypothetical protein